MLAGQQCGGDEERCMSRSALEPIWAFVGVSGLETRGLHALTREKAVDGLTVNSQHPSNPHSVEPAVVDQTPDGLGMDTELVRNLPDTHEAWFATGGRHNP
jgi:hypothetical protein